MATKSAPHPAIRTVLQDSNAVQYSDSNRGPVALSLATSVSLARALAVGGLSRLDPSLTTVDVWE